MSLIPLLTVANCIGNNIGYILFCFGKKRMFSVRKCVSSDTRDTMVQNITK